MYAILRDGTRVRVEDLQQEAKKSASANDSSLINDFNKLNNKSLINDSMIDRRQKSIEDVEQLADYLVNEYSAPESRKFFLKVAWRLSGNFILEAVRISRKSRINQPLRYFCKVCAREMR